MVATGSFGMPDDEPRPPTSPTPQHGPHGRFADGANRLGGHYRVTAGLLVALILLGVAVAVWDSIVFIFGILLG